MEFILDILKGAVIGLANVIPGVSGGTMMVTVGIYDKFLWCVNHLFKAFGKAVKILLPIFIGIVAAVVIGAFGLKYLFANYPLPTNTLFIGLILGGVPMLLKSVKGTKIGVPGAVAFAALFALVVWLKVIEGENVTSITLNFGTILVLFVLGAVCAAAMVIPGVSGSMILKTLGYYEPVWTGAIPDFVHGLTHGGGEELWHAVGILLPFGLGIVFGIFAVAKLIAWLLEKHRGVTFSGILGMVAASPVVILMDRSNWADLRWGVVLCSLLTFALGFFAAMKLGGEPEVKA